MLGVESFDTNITGFYSPGDSEVRAKELSYKDALKKYFYNGNGNLTWPSKYKK